MYTQSTSVGMFALTFIHSEYPILLEHYTNLLLSYAIVCHILSMLVFVSGAGAGSEQK